MIMQPNQRKRFIKLVDAVTLYVNDRLGVVESRALLSGPRRSIDSQAQSRVMQALWEDPSLIDNFANENPFGLSRRDLEEVRSWADGLEGYFMATYDGGQIILLAGGYAFEVRGISRELEDMLTQVPTTIRTMIIPFDGIVTYTVAIIELPVNIGPNMQASIAEEIAEAHESGKVVSKARDFAAAAAAIREKWEQDAIEDTIREAENILAAELPAPGAHRGALAGLSEEERKAALEAHDAELADEYGDTFWGDDPVYTMKTTSRNGSPKFKLEELLAPMRKDELVDLAVDLEVDPIDAYAMKKAELAHAIAEAMDDPDTLYDGAMPIPSNHIDIMLSVIEAGGRLYIPDAEASFETMMPPFEPLLFLYHTKHTFVYVVPDELVEGMAKLDWESLRLQARLREDVRKLAAAAVELRGIVPLAEFIEDVRTLHPELEDGEEIVALTLHASASLPLFVILVTEDDAFLLDSDLFEDYLDECGHEAQMESRAPLCQGPLGETLDDLLEAQDKREPRPIPPEMLDFPLAMLWRETLPATRAMRNWLDENIPDSADDYEFADQVVRKFLREAKRGEISTETPVMYLEMLADEGLELDEAHIQPFLDRLMNLLNTQPIWTNNGWSPAEMR